MDGMKRIRNMTFVVAVATLVALALAVPALAEGAEVTRGDILVFADGAGLGYGAITGRAQMIRTADGKTIVNVQVTGLTPGSTYGSHVHNQACSVGTAGGHYGFGHTVTGGAGPANSEIWPGPFTANAAGHATGMVMVDETAGATAVSVVIHGPGGQKIACADLS